MSNLVEVKFELRLPGAKAPLRGTPFSAGWDFYTIDEGKSVRKGHAEWVPGYGCSYLEYETGVAVEIPPGHMGFCFPRSSISNTSLLLANSVGTIDADYRGTVKGRFRYLGKVTNHHDIYKTGDRIFQMIVLPFPEVKWTLVDKLSETVRGEGGWGSTGRS